MQAVREHARHVAIQTINSGLFASRSDLKADLQISKLSAEQEIEPRNTFGLAPTLMQETRSRDIAETELPNGLRPDFVYKGSVHAERKHRGRGSPDALRAVYIEDDKAGMRGKDALIDRLLAQVSQCCSGQLPPHMHQRWMSMKRLWETFEDAQCSRQARQCPSRQDTSWTLFGHTLNREIIVRFYSEHRALYLCRGGKRNANTPCHSCAP